MLQPAQQPSAEELELLGDFHPLLEQLGSVDGLVTLDSAADSLQIRQITNLPALRTFLRDYQARILGPVELPAIQWAFLHTSRNELRELVALDRQLEGEPILKNFSSASRRVGQAQLRRLRPLRDDRFLRRYLDAVDHGRASGWHTLVFGVTLAVYSLPLRQGLLGYARQTTRGFIEAAARSLRIPHVKSRSLFDELSGKLPAAVDSVFTPTVMS